MKRNFTILSFILALCTTKFIAQTYNAVNLTGFNYDVIAESKPAASSTTLAIESNYVLYSAAYNGTLTGAAGLPISGTYSTTTRTYNLAPYTAKNTLRVGFNSKDSVSLATPAKYSVISLLGFAASNDALTDITVRFTDGSSAVYNSKTFYNWTSSQPAFMSGFGKTNRTTDVIYFTPSEPKMYTIDLPIACTDQSKMVSKIVIKNNTNASFVHLFAVSAVNLASYVASSTANVACKGATTGSAKVFAIDSYGPLSYSWNSSPVQTTQQATNLVAGAYTVTITDGNGCVFNNTVAITEPAATFSVTAITANSVACITSATGLAQVIVNGGDAPYTYTWTNSAATTFSAGGLTPRNYTVSIKDANNCMITASTTVTSPVVSIAVSTSSLLCSSAPNATATVSSVTGATGPYTYTWTTSPVQTSTVATAITAGTYSVLVKDASNCVNTQTFTISAPNFSVMTSVATCTSASGSATVSAVTGGAGAPYTYVWSSLPTQTTSIATGMTPGNYSVTVTDAASCAITRTLSIGSSFPTLSVSTTSIACGNSATGSASVSVTGGLGGPYTYSWTSTPIQTTATASNLVSGSYAVTVMGTGGCTATQGFNINRPTLTISTTSITCVNSGLGSAMVASVNGGTAPYLYYWNGSTVPGTNSISDLPVNTYSVAVVDANNCVISSSYSIDGPTNVFNAVVTTTAATCSGINNGRALVSPSGATAPYTFLWSTTPVQTTALATGLAAPRTYTCTIFDFNNCFVKKEAMIYPAPLNINIAVSPSKTICPTSSATLSVIGATSYTWSTGGTTPSINVTPTASLTVYSFTGTATTGCNISGTTTIVTSTAAVNCVVGIEEYTNTSYNLYPNPNNGRFTLKLDRAQDNSTLEVMDALGKIVLSQNMSGEETTVNTSSLQSGIYFVLVKNNVRILVKTKIIKQ